jgi:hypothetical protein
MNSQFIFGIYTDMNKTLAGTKELNEIFPVDKATMEHLTLKRTLIGYLQQRAVPDFLTAPDPR